MSARHDYRPEIDGLRAIAVIVVLLFHAHVAGFAGGYVGVDVFFVISGYLITGIIVRERDRGTFSLVGFYERRVRRLIPALYLVTLASVPLAYFTLLPSFFEDYAKSLVTIPLALSNVLFWSERGYFGASIDLKPMVHTWSLAVEEQFYLAYPLTLALIGTRRRGRLVVAMVIVGLISLAASYYVSRTHFETAFYLPFARAWELIAGGLIAILASRVDLGGLVSPRVRTALSLVGLLLIAYSVAFFDAGTVFPGVAAIVPVAGTALLLVFASAPSPVRSLLAWRPLVFVGLLSYSIYLWHQPLFAFFRHRGLDEHVHVAVLVPLVLVLSYVTWRFVETPFRRARSARVQLFGSTALVGTLIVGVGLVGWSSRGFLDRFDANDQALLAQFSTLSEYNNARFNDLVDKEFVSSDKVRVVIVGDSYAKDLVNVVVEAGLDREIEMSTKQINGECGNLFLDEDFSGNIPANRVHRCRALGWYESPSFQALLHSADELWLSSSWQPWVIDLLPESVQRLEAVFGVRVRVFGVKNFGPVSQPMAMRVPPVERPVFTQAVPERFIAMNEQMATTLPAETFVEILEPFCSGTALACRVFTDDGLVVSPDGGHLSEAGAQYLSSTFLRIVDGFW